MALNTETIVPQLRRDVEALVDNVTGPESASQDVYGVELHLFRQLLALEAALFKLFFPTRAAVRPATPTTSQGVGMRYHSRRSVHHISIFNRVALTDGAEALQNQILALFPAYTLILDILHVSEYLWDAATALLGETNPERIAWLRPKLVLLLEGKTAEVIRSLEVEAARPTCSVSQRKALERTIGYYRRNQPYMHYDHYLAQGWPIGTGVVEGACGHLLKDRMEQAGMRWTMDGAQAILDLRAVRLNGDWDAYWRFHRQHKHQRLCSSPATACPEEQALQRAA